jgi:acetolactate synthase-1/2/3 large subunit
MVNDSKKIRVVDYIANKINELGVNHIFTITGGGAMFLNDAILRHENIEAICNHHEQASAMAAVGYAKYSGKLGVVMPTTGCGCTNTITGLLDAWQDNVPMLFVSGQINSHQTMDNYDLPLRQIGVQEADVVTIVSSITKYAVLVKDPTTIRYHMERAIHEAFSGRSGPVWLDIPLDVQSAMIDPDELQGYEEPEDPIVATEIDLSELDTYFSFAKRPVILAGNGIRLADAQDEFQSFVENNNIPVVNTYLAADLLPTDHPLNIGRVGIKGNRAANFALQNSDLLLVIGSRLGIPVTGYIYENFAREAKIVVVDIDENEHKKNTVCIDHFIHSDAKYFLQNATVSRVSDNWTSTCLQWKNMWPVYLPEHMEDDDGISFYGFMKVLSECMSDDDVVVSDAGSAYYVSSQAVHIEKQQRYITSGAQADMGFTLPAAIGVSVARGGKNVIGIVGDGSFQLNIQELQTMVHNNLPVKMFVWNNNGYLSIRTTQRKFFDDGFIGTDVNSGISFPDLTGISSAYDIKYINVSDIDMLKESIDEVMLHDGPVICEIMCKEWDAVLPTIGSKKLPDGKMFSRPLEDMYPFLTREEFMSNMIIEPLPEN